MNPKFFQISCLQRSSNPLVMDFADFAESQPRILAAIEEHVLEQAALGDSRVSVKLAMESIRAQMKVRIVNGLAPAIADYLIKKHPKLLLLIKRAPRVSIPRGKRDQKPERVGDLLREAARIVGEFNLAIEVITASGTRYRIKGCQ